MRHAKEVHQVYSNHESIVEATIAELQAALSSKRITSVELVAKYLHRIARYDIRGPCLNSIPLLNPDVFDEARASDERRANGTLRGPLDGIPYTLKESMKYKGQPCSAGSPALVDLIANEDCFIAEQLRAAGAVCIGRTNTPPMMASGMHRGVHGRAESPYNLDYLTAAFSSGSSNGSGSSTAASFAAFGIGSETVSSGRSPASNNALIAYTPSRTVISPRGVWPLYPTCDVVVPHTRTVEDMLAILDVLAMQDRTTAGDFWREQKYVEVPPVPKPKSFPQLAESAAGSLKGKTLAIPKIFIGGKDSSPHAKATVVSQDVIDLWDRARKDLENLGATVIETDFPLVVNYENDSVSGHANNVEGFTPDWNGKERGELVAYLWDDFLRENGDAKYPTLGSVDGSQMFPRPKDYIPDRYMEHKNFMDYPNLVRMAQNRNGKSIWEIDGIAHALPALEAQRTRDLEAWMSAHGIDAVVFPANGSVGRADVDTNDESARHALQNGVKYSNGNRAIRHMGVPTVSVTMGRMESLGRMPVNLTFAGRHGQDAELLQFAYAYEQRTKLREAPGVTPPLPSDQIREQRSEAESKAGTPCEITVLKSGRATASEIEVEGRLTGEAMGKDVTLEAYVDGQPVDPRTIHLGEDGAWSLRGRFVKFEPPEPLYGGLGMVVENVMVVLLARSAGACVAGLLLLIPA